MREFHGQTKVGKVNPLYKLWQSMKDRCDNPNNKQYKDYGERGITLCKEWYSYTQFYLDMGERPEGLTLERIDNSLGYCPPNCKWATRSEQSLNQRTRRDGSSGRRGVSKDGNSWYAYGNIEGKRFKLYYGSSFELACEARETWERANKVPYYE